MRFQVPQFVEVEDKIFGPLTATQFVFLAGGIGFLVAMWLLLPTFLAVIIGGPVAALGIGLAFYKVNDRPLINMLQSAFEYLTRHKLYIWEKKKVPTGTAEELSLSHDERGEDPSKYVPSATASKIKDLAWSLDIKDHTKNKVEGGRL